MPGATSFDDGPRPDWTPKILDALDGADAKATFFVGGELAARHKDIVRDELARGAGWSASTLCAALERIAVGCAGQPACWR